MRRVTRNPSVTAGLKIPPEMKPNAETITAITRPFASASRSSMRAKAARAGADEDQGERPDELGDAAAEVITLEHAANLRTGIGRTPRQPIQAPLLWSIACPVTPSDVAGGEPRNGPGDLRRLAHPPQRHFLHGDRPRLVGGQPRPRRQPLPRHVRVDPAGADRVHLDLARRQLRRVRAHQAEQPGLRRAVRRVAGDADAGEDRRRDDDAPALGQQRLGGAAAPVGAGEVGRDDVVPAVAVPACSRRRCPRSRRACRAAR